MDGWPQFECNFNIFADMILPYGSHCIDMTPSPEPINGATGTWLSCFATCDWLRALVHLHCDVIITTSTTKTWWSSRSLRVDLPCLRKKICHQNTMWMRWKVCKFKDEDLKILGRQDSSWNSAPFVVYLWYIEAALILCLYVHYSISTSPINWCRQLLSIYGNRYLQWNLSITTT